MYKFVFVGSLYDYNTYIEKEIAKSNKNVFTCESLNKSLHGFSYILYKLHNSSKINKFVRLPFRNVWVKKILDKETSAALKSNDKICFIYSGGINYLQMGFIDYLKHRYPNSKYVFYFTDLVEVYMRNNPDFFKKYAGSFDLLITYNEIDADKYKIHLAPPRIISFSYVEDDPSIEPSDVFFVGREKGRLQELLKIYELCVENGLKCDFHIMDVPREKQRYADNITYNQFMSYEEVLKHCKRAKCILNYIQKGAVGITLRDYEAIGMNKFLMTNNPAIKTSAFYTCENIIWIENLQDEIGKLKNGNMPVIWNGREKYSVSNYFSWLENMLESK